eukprot:TRINITY_DN1185_c0_g1_i2.p1 TRINITY_DN1185_c0_g1~~TRINITY_DN1185_c0_g1_i2.p1  ORF type:complete len:455 (+),score=85.32 TRINITY_DN1185_c0_g1_i2:147-1511(+)
MTCNFLLFTEDPKFHSVTEVDIPFAGNAVQLLILNWPPGAQWIALKLCIGLFSLGIGLIVGKFLLHKLILKRWWRLKLFKEDRGSFFCMAITTGICLVTGSYLYNFILLLGMEDYSEHLLNGKLIMDNQTFGKIAMIGKWLGDSTSLFLVLDMMLQEKKHYRQWAPRLRAKWDVRMGKTLCSLRIIAFWVYQLIMTPLVLALVLANVIDWSKAGFGSTGLERGILAGIVACCDMAIVAQDWEYPRFKTNTDVKLPGMETGNLKCNCLAKYPVVITGKWFNYGIVLAVMVLDFNALNNHLSYNPMAYGQYVHPETQRIMTITNVTEAYDYNQLNWTVRWMENKTESDIMLSSRYLGLSWGWRLLVIVPTALIAIGFFAGTYLGNKRVTRIKKAEEAARLLAEEYNNYSGIPERVSMVELDVEDKYDDKDDESSSSVEQEDEGNVIDGGRIVAGFR